MRDEFKSERRAGILAGKPGGDDIGCLMKRHESAIKLSLVSLVKVSDNRLLFGINGDHGLEVHDFMLCTCIRPHFVFAFGASAAFCPF